MYPHHHGDYWNTQVLPKLQLGKLVEALICLTSPTFHITFFLVFIFPFHCIAPSTPDPYSHCEPYMLGQGSFPMDSTCFIPLLRDLCVMCMGNILPPWHSSWRWPLLHYTPKHWNRFNTVCSYTLKSEFRYQ